MNVRTQDPTRHPIQETRAPSVDDGPVGRVVAGSVVAGAAAAAVLTLVVFAGGTEAVITGSVAARLRSRLGAPGRPQPASHQPAPDLGHRPGGRDGRLRPRAGRPGPRQRRPDLGELGVAAGRAGTRGVDVLPHPPQPDPPRPVDAHSGHRGPRPRLGRRRLPGPHPRRERVRRPGDPLRRRRAPAAPRLPRPGQPHRGAVQRSRRDLRLLGADRRPGRRQHQGLRLRPRRGGLERRGRPPPGRARGRRGPARTCSPPPESPARWCSSATRSAAPTR